MQPASVVDARKATVFLMLKVQRSPSALQPSVEDVEAIDQWSHKSKTSQMKDVTATTALWYSWSALQICMQPPEP